MDSPQIAAIVTGGTLPEEDRFYGPFLRQASYKIAADSGLGVCHRLNIKPDLLVGDLDSVSEETFRWAEQNDIPMQTFPIEKDATDTQLAIDIAIKMQKNEIFILGGIGNRLDHTLGNLYLLTYASEKGANARLLNPGHHIQLLSPGFMVQVQGKPRDLVSILPISDVLRGVTMEGFHWDLNEVTIERGSTVGISNYLEKEIATVSVKQGYAFVMQVRE